MRIACVLALLMGLSVACDLPHEEVMGIKMGCPVDQSGFDIDGATKRTKEGGSVEYVSKQEGGLFDFLIAGVDNDGVVASVSAMKDVSALDNHEVEALIADIKTQLHKRWGDSDTSDNRSVVYENINSDVVESIVVATSSKSLLVWYSAKEQAKEQSGDKSTVIEGWLINRDVSPIDDSEVVVVGAQADSYIESKYGDKSKPVLIIRCSENTTELYIGFGLFLTVGSITPTIRLDKDKAINNEVWSTATNSEAMFKRRPIPFIKKMMERESLFVQVVPYGDNPVSTTFTLKGLDEAIKPLREACNW